MVFAFWWSGSGHLLSLPWSDGLPMIALGRLSGLLLQIALLVQLLLIGRIPFIEREVGFDRLNRVHRLLGYTLVSFVLLHPILLSFGYAPLRQEGPASSFAGIVRGFEDVPRALIGAILLLSVVVVSVPWVRRKLRYESWHAAHLATYAALALSFGHQTSSGGDFSSRSFYWYWLALNGAAVGLFFAYRFIRPFMLWRRHRFVVQRVVQESPDAWSVYIAGRAMDSFRFEPGQFANLHLLSRGLWAGHPFSFSREYDGRAVRFTIKALGGDTSLIAQLKPGTRVIIDGPLGVFTPSHAVTEKFLLIGGGIGITPLRAIAGDCAARHADTVVLYGAKTEEHTALLHELSGLVPATHVFLSDQTEAHMPNALLGHIDAAAVRRLVPDAAQRDVYVCGPPGMMDAVIRSLRSLGVPPAQIHAERFAY
jgi:predicted ferric reductase